ncbi:acylphosphatase [[Pasteurella] mairii]|uniref:acylphosphatase n=1 Tax=[Pasteurella] mairii TaxID=757 RepID=A0A379B3K4_9PAST|nr:acylphosphatase [[Pasteurella] mairii]
MMLKKHFLIYGRVQGVSFRYFTWKQANVLALCGMVRNRKDGSVEVIAMGEDSQIDALYHWLQQGPKTADVKQVIMQDYVGQAVFDDFSVQR